MSRQRSRSPRYTRTNPPRHEGAGSHSRRPPWNNDDYGESHNTGPTETDEMPFERNRHPRDDAGGEHWNDFREETTRHAAKRRTTPPSLMWLPTVHPPRHHQEEYGRKRTPPSHSQPRPHPEEYHGRRTRSPPSQPREQPGGYDVERRRLSPKQPFHRHEGGGDNRGRGDDSRAFENDERQHHQSPQRLPPRERFVPNPTAPSHHHKHQQQQREPALNLAARETNRGRSRDGGGAARSTSHDRGGQRHGRKADPQGPSYKERRRAEPHHDERSPALSNRHRREMDDALNHGYGKEEEDFSSPEQKPRDGFGLGGGDRGELRGPQKASFSHREDRGPSRPVIVEHDHGISHSGPSSQWESRDPDLDGESQSRPPAQKGSLHEQFRRMNRSNAREELRHHHRPLHHDDNGEPGGRVNRANNPREELSGYRPLHHDDDDADAGRERSRSPVRSRDRTRSPTTGFPDGGGSSSNYGDRSPPPARGRGGRMNASWGGRRMGTGPPRSHPPPVGHRPPQERSQGPPQQPQRRDSNRSAGGAGDFYIGSREEEPSGWTEEDMEPKMPRPRSARENKWNSQQQNPNKEMTVVTEETLTIKVDMSRPVNQNSQQCYSSDRQLSLDLVNVGRQRLDFLPMLEHSGMYRESSMHTGTFAQEIITLVHQVKELYFGGYGTTLTERFAVLKKAPPPEKEYPVEEPLTLNRRFNMNKTVLPEDDEPLFPRLGDMHDDSLFSRLGDMQPPRQQQQQMVRDPGDLRFDLDRRRQERLEGVKVTIPGGGGGPKQQPLVGVRSDQNAEYDDQESNEPMGERGGSSAWSAEEEPLERSWSEEEEPQEEESWSGAGPQQGRWSGAGHQGPQQRRWRGNMGPRRGGASHRQNSGPQRRTHRPGNRPGQMRWQNNRNNVTMNAGADW